MKVNSRPFGAVTCFLVIAYGLTWLVQVPGALANHGVLQVHISKNLWTMAQVAPAVAALLTVGWFQGRGAIRALLVPIIRVKASIRWYALVLVAPFAAWAVAMLAYRMFGRSVPVLGSLSEVPLLTALGLPFCLGEELGWRGFLLERLMRRKSQRAATGWVAFWWGLWHLPAYLSQNSVPHYLLFLLGIFPVSSVFTFTYSRTRSVFLCVLLHSSIDAGANYWLAPLPDGDLLYWGLMDAVLWLAAIPVFIALAKAPKPGTLAEMEQ